MKQVKPKHHILARFIFLPTVVLLGLALFFFKTKAVNVASSIYFLSISSTYFFYENWVWRLYIPTKKTFHVGRKISCKPNLSGTWKGTIDRNDERGAHDFTIEITQTAYITQVHTKSETGKTSESISASFSTDDLEKGYTLIYTWLGAASKLRHDLAEPGKFFGTTILTIDFDEKGHASRMHGHYFTDRQPRQTRGIIEVSKVQ
jgi:hypothetical protein